MEARYILAAAVTAVLSLSSCADLGFGVDVDSGGVGTYWNDYGPYGGLWGSPYWNYGPVYNGPLYNGPIYGPPHRPPFIDTNPGPVIRPPQSRPPQINVNPGINTVPATVGGIARPGNGGLPSTPVPSTPAQSTSGGLDNNARR